MGINNSSNNLFLQQKVVNSNTNYNVLYDDVIINITDTSSLRTVTLPTPSSLNIGKFFVVKDASGGASTNNITVSPLSAEIDGEANYVIGSNYGSAVFYSDGKNYFIKNYYSKEKSTIALFKARKSSAIGIPSNVSTKITNYDVPIFDTPNAFNRTTGVYTVPTKGKYLCLGAFIVSNTGLEEKDFEIGFSINGAAVQEVGLDTTKSPYPSPEISTILNLNKGDTVDMRVQQKTSITVYMYTDPRYNFFQIAQLEND